VPAIEDDVVAEALRAPRAVTLGLMAAVAAAVAATAPFCVATDVPVIAAVAEAVAATAPFCPRVPPMPTEQEQVAETAPG
jgi:hypothetical protein